MCEIEIVKTREETEKYYELLQEEKTSLPAFLYDDPRYIPTVAAWRKKGTFSGLVFGVMQEGDANFYLHYLRMGRAALTRRDIRLFSETFFQILKRDHGAAKVLMSIDQKDDSMPLYVDIIKEMEKFTLDKVLILRQVGVRTKDFGHFRQYHWYCPGLMEKKGFEAIPIDDCPGSWREELREKEEKGEVSKDYLSPGLWENTWKYDPDTSYVLVKKGEKHPLGWIVTERISDQTVKLRRFYIYDEVRRRRLGPSFSTWALERIEERYEMLWFEVEKGNRQMEMFSSCYCGPILAFNYFKCNLTINL